MTRDKLIKKIATWIMMTIMLSVFSLDVICVAMCNIYQSRVEISPAQFSSDGTADRIHFLNTNNSDAILIESNGKFALIDSGEGDYNPRRKLSYDGSEEDVIKYRRLRGQGNARVCARYAQPLRPCRLVRGHCQGPGHHGKDFLSKARKSRDSPRIRIRGLGR